MGLLEMNNNEKVEEENIEIENKRKETVAVVNNQVWVYITQTLAQNGSKQYNFKSVFLHQRLYSFSDNEYFESRTFKSMENPPLVLLSIYYFLFEKLLKDIFLFLLFRYVHYPFHYKGMVERFTDFTDQSEFS